MPDSEEFNLFAYGTLKNPGVFGAVTGLRLVGGGEEADGRTSFRAVSASLDGYKKVSFDRTYEYAVPDSSGRIDGYLIGPLPGRVMTLLSRYEGQNYVGRQVRVRLGGDGRRERSAFAFVGNLELLLGRGSWAERSFEGRSDGAERPDCVAGREVPAASGDNIRA